MNCKYKSTMTKKKAFTLIELLIVIAIIGILFIVLVSKVDFATDKAKAVGVQSDFRSFQMALETVSKEKAGFNSFGWNTGDANANGVRDSVDEGDANMDGVYQSGETWTGRKKYLETWTNTYSLIRPGTTFAADGYDKDAIFALETAINKNLDPKLHITIDAKTGLITMANGYQDPWNTQYHGAYISAEDGMDRGAIVMYSNGANQKFGSEHSIANGVPTVIVPGNNKQGADDYSLVVIYTYKNGYGEVGNLTTGFSNNQLLFTGNGGNIGGNIVVTPDDIEVPLPLPAENPSGDLQYYYENGGWSSIKALAQARLSKEDYASKYGIEPGDVIEANGYKYFLVDLGMDNNGDGILDHEERKGYDGFVFMYNTNTESGMNTLNISDGGYVHTNVMKAYVDDLYTNLTDADLKKAIKKVSIHCNSGDINADGTDNNGSSIYITDAYMFLAAAVEVNIPLNGGKYPLEGTQFDYFTGVGSQSIRDNFAKPENANISSDWWLRTADSSRTNCFIVVPTTGGTSGSKRAAYDAPIVATFVIG